MRTKIIIINKINNKNKSGIFKAREKKKDRKRIEASKRIGVN